jgi:hypothetical protein
MIFLTVTEGSFWVSTRVPFPVSASREETGELYGMRNASLFVSSSAKRISRGRVREESISLKENVLRAGCAHDIFSRKIVTMRDRIFPARNQVRAWGKQHCELMKWSHFPFYQQSFRQELFSSNVDDAHNPKI